MDEGRGSALSDEHIIRLVKAARRLGVTKIRLSGGEPLLRPGLSRLVSRLKKDVGVPELSLTTNGLALSEMAEELRKAGLDRVNVSLDSLDPDRFDQITRGGNLGRVLEGMKAAEEAGLTPLKINMVPLAGMNDDEIPAFAALTLDRDVHVRFIERMPVRDAAGGPRPVLLPEIRRRVEEVGRLVEFPFHGLGPSRNFRLEGARGVIGFISPVSQHFCDSCSRLRVTAAGRLRPCLLHDRSVDVAGPLADGCSDEDLDALFTRAVLLKPTGHNLDSATAESVVRAMNAIGG